MANKLYIKSRLKSEIIVNARVDKMSSSGYIFTPDIRASLALECPMSIKQYRDATLPENLSATIDSFGLVDAVKSTAFTCPQHFKEPPMIDWNGNGRGGKWLYIAQPNAQQMSNDGNHRFDPAKCLKHLREFMISTQSLSQEEFEATLLGITLRADDSVAKHVAAVFQGGKLGPFLSRVFGDAFGEAIATAKTDVALKTQLKRISRTGNSSTPSIFCFSPADFKLSKPKIPAKRLQRPAPAAKSHGKRKSAGPIYRPPPPPTEEESESSGESGESGSDESGEEMEEDTEQVEEEILPPPPPAPPTLVQAVALEGTDGAGPSTTKKRRRTPKGTKKSGNELLTALALGNISS